jgi:hypothetical protein
MMTLPSSKSAHKSFLRYVIPRIYLSISVPLSLSLAAAAAAAATGRVNIWG